MKRKLIYLNSVALIVLMLLSSFNGTAQVKGWFLSGSDPANYEIGLETDQSRNGKVAFLMSNKKVIKNGFGTIMQTFDAQIYSGKTVELSGFIKSEDIEKWAGMWMRVDAKNKHAVSFDNMQDRPIEGSTDWKRYKIILEVPKNSTSISYGVLVSGSGKVLLDDLKFKVVTEVETQTGRQKLQNPSNGSFEE